MNQIHVSCLQPHHWDTSHTCYKIRSNASHAPNPTPMGEFTHLVRNLVQLCMPPSPHHRETSHILQNSVKHPHAPSHSKSRLHTSSTKFGRTPHAPSHTNSRPHTPITKFGRNPHAPNHTNRRYLPIHECPAVNPHPVIINAER